MGTNIKYNNFDFRASGLATPTLSINSTFNFTDGGAIIGETINISLRGQIRGSGNLNDTGNWKNTNPTNWSSMSSLVSGMEKSFSEDYKELEILCGSDPLFSNILDDKAKDKTKVNKIEFSNRTDEYLVQIIDYSIDLQIEKPPTGEHRYAGLTDVYVSSIENSYTIKSSDSSEYLRDPGLSGLFPSGNSRIPYTITRKIGAVGKATHEGALNNAKSCVTGLLYRDIAFFNVLNNLSITDRSSTIEADSINGSYSITDIFKSYSGVGAPLFTETFSVASVLDDKFNRNITINGTIQGLKTLPTNSDNLYWDISSSFRPFFFQTNNHTGNIAYVNASGQFNTLLTDNTFYQRALVASFSSGNFLPIPTFQNFNSNNNLGGRTTWLHPDPISANVEHNKVDGSIVYTFVYDSRPLNLFPNSIEEQITISDNYGIRERVAQTVFRRMPIIQDISTYSLPTRTVNYTVTLPVTGSAIAHIPSSIRTNMINIIEKFNPNKLYSSTAARIVSWEITNKETHDPFAGSFKKNITWAYEIQSRHSRS